MRQNLAILALFFGGISAAETDNKKNASLENYKRQAMQNLAQLEVAAEVDAMEDDDDTPKDEVDTDKAYDPKMEKMRKETAGTKSKVRTPSTTESLNDEDAKCYASRFNDIDAMLDPKTHYATTGIAQGRLGTCARRLTDYEAQRYLNQNPDLQRQFGTKGPASLEQARQHWQSVGYKNSVFAATVVDELNKPFKCASSGSESCNCPGTTWIGLQTRPDNKAKIETFEEMREWRTLGKVSDGWVQCSAADFDSDPMPGVDKQCYCEVKDKVEAVRCADEGDQCFCAGHVYFTKLYANDDKTAKVTINDAMELGFAIVDNLSGQVSCSSDTFGGADPFPGAEKQCFCDAKRHFTTQDDLRLNQQYWIEQGSLSMSEVEITTLVTQVEQAATIEKAFTETIKEQDTSGDVVSASCEICNHDCSADTEKTLTTEISKRKTVITQKFGKLKEINKQKQVIAEQKKIQGETSCAAAQKSKNPAEKKKYQQMCSDLRVESSKLITEVTIEKSTIDEQQRQEEKILQEETETIISSKESKTIDQEKVTEINKAKLIESQATRITKETDEQISVIKQKVETEKYEQSVIQQQTTVIEKQVTNLVHQIEQTEQTIIREIQEEKEESEDAGEEVDTSAKEAEEELTSVIEEKKTDLEDRKSTITSTVEEYTSKSTELETTIETTTKKITEVREKIDKKVTETNTLVTQREELKTSLKVVAVTEKSKIQEQIDKITTDITTIKKDVETYTTEREEIVTEETTARTELTYTTQTLKQATVEKEQIEEQITVTEVVISSKKEEVKEEEEKTEIIKKQVECFKKKQELLIKKEEIKAFKSTVNTQINKKTKIKETNEVTLTTQKEELKVIEENIKTYKDQVKNTKDEAQIKIIETKIENIEKEEKTVKETIEKTEKIVSTITEEVTELTTGKSVSSKEEEVKTLEKEVETVTTEAVTVINKLPLVKSEVTETVTNEDGSVSTTTTSSTTTSSVSGTTYPGTVTSVTIKGNIGGSSSTSSTTSTTDVTTQVIEKQETATKMREEATRIKEVGTTQTVEITEVISKETELIESVEKTITSSKETLTGLRTKEKELNTKITTSTESTDVESYRRELTVITGQISTTKEVIKSSTEKKITSEEKVTESKTMITEIKSKIESSEEEAKSSEEEAITYISEGIEATYVVNKQQVYEHKVETQKKSEQEYGSKKVKYEEETTKWTKKLNEKKTLKVTATSELKDINSRIDILTTRLEKVKDEEKKSVEKEISSLKSEVTRYEKIIEGYTTEITTITSTIKTIYTTWTTYYTYYIRVRAETSNSLQVSRQTERTSINRIRRRNHRHSHKHRVIQIKQNAIAHRHAVTETRKTVERKSRQLKRQQTSHRVVRIKSEQKIKSCTKTVTNTQKKIKEMKEKKVVIKSESEKTKIEEEITALETIIETEKAVIKTETTKKTKAEDDEAIVTTKISESQEVVKRVEKETERIEQEAKSIETSFTSETTTKVSKEVKKRTKETKTRRRQALKQKIKNLKKVIKTKKEKVVKQTKKIIESTKKITESSNKITRVTEVRDRQTRVSKYAGCQRLLVEQPTFFEMTTICAAAVSRLAQIQTSSTTSSTTVTTTSATSVVGPASSTCQICYSQNTACNGGGSLSGISVVSFAVDTQGEAETIVSQLFGESLVGDVNFVLGQVNPKYQVFGQPVTTSSQTKVELVTSDSKVQQVVSMVNNWMTSHGKTPSGKSSEAQVTALTGGSNSYVQTIMKATGAAQVAQPQLRSAKVMAVQKEMDEDKPNPSTNIESFIARVYE